MKPTLNIYDASQTRDLSKLAPAKESTMSADIDREKAAAFLRDTIKLHDEWAADRTAQAFGTPYKAWLAAKYPCEMTAARVTPSPAPIQQAQQDSCIPPSRAWGHCVWCNAPSTVIGRFPCSAPDGDGHMFQQSAPAAPTVKASQ